MVIVCYCSCQNWLWLGSDADGDEGVRGSHAIRIRSLPNEQEVRGEVGRRATRRGPWAKSPSGERRADNVYRQVSIGDTAAAKGGTGNNNII